MKARVLPPAEWKRLEVSGLPPIWLTARPEDVDVVVVEDHREIVATMSVVRVPLLESLWIKPRYRGNVAVARQLVGQTIDVARRWADNWVIATANTDRMRDIIGRVGGKRLEVDTFMIPLGRKEGAA